MPTRIQVHTQNLSLFKIVWDIEQMCFTQGEKSALVRLIPRATILESNRSSKWNINKIYSNVRYIIKNNIIFYNIKYIRVFEYAHDYLLTNSLGVSNEQAPKSLVFRTHKDISTSLLGVLPDWHNCEAPWFIGAPVRINQVNQVIFLPCTTVWVAVVNVNNRSVLADARAFITNYHANLSALFLFATQGSIHFLLYSIRFRIKFSTYLSWQYYFIIH